MGGSDLDRRRAAGGPHHRLAQAQRTRAELLSRGRWQEADEMVTQALSDAGVVSGEDVGRLVYVPGARAFRSSETEARSTGTARVSAVRALLLANRGLHRAEAVRQADLVLASPARDHVSAFWAAVLTLIHAEELPAAIGACGRASSASPWTRSALHRDALMLLRGRIRAAAGRITDAATLFGRVRERDTSPQLSGVAAAWHAEALSALGEHRQAYVVLHECGFDAAGTGHPERAELLAARSATHLAAGNFQLGLEDALACGEQISTCGVHNPAVLPWRSRAALCAAALGRSGSAVALAQQELDLARRWGTHRGQGIALHALGIARRDAGSVEALLEAESLLSTSPDTRETARVRYDLGCLLLSRERFDEAASFLAASAETASHPWSGYATTVVGRLARGPWTPSLTDQEKKVAGLALAGLSNKEIALDVHLTARTVEFHLSNAYRKLGISGRDELAVAALLIR
ncbi:LuxR C-terminal-related transcriptional regulator [Saccharothrix saharensis]|uniref:LuxR C-terminal-related transcriptional regulator n=1 Tax=Saccharothrix saharensis TaxID=571190 RepID=UPI0036A26174